MSLIDTVGATTLLRECNKRKARDFIESLGLINTNPGRASARFDDPKVVQLNKRVIAAVDAVFDKIGKTRADRQAHLTNEEVLDDWIKELCAVFGPELWGRSNRNHLLTAGLCELYPKDLYFDVEEDRKAIELYLRCWIVKRGSRRVGSERGKIREVQNNQTAGSFEKAKKPLAGKIVDVSDSDSSSSSSFETSGSGSRSTTARGKMAESFYRAPPARMYPTPQPQPIRTQPTEELSVRATANSSCARDAADDLMNDDLYAPPSQETSSEDEETFSSRARLNKRKRRDSVHRTPRGKLPKVHIARKAGVGIDVSDISDLYSVPRSPSAVFTADPFPTTFDRRRIRAFNEVETFPSRESTIQEQDADNQINDTINQIWKDVEAAETSNPSPPFICHGLPASLLPSCSVTDSVIPSDTQYDVIPVRIDLTGTDTSIDTAINEPRSATLAPNKTILPAFTVTEENKLRRELFKLLLSRFSDLNQFKSELDHKEPEDRLNMLLNQFWFNDLECLRMTEDDRFVDLQMAFQSWMDMRTKLHDFQISSEYLGKPGDEWQAYLRSLTSTEQRSRACIALMDLRDSLGDGNTIVKDTFNKNMMTIFDLLTKIPDCNGVEAFCGLADYNRKLLAWFP
ncbi:uncharacterized protein BDR25DRAFT_343980 [Lindgomyces ingoldianus]|uniref:Uncharacterized protein n=1 Tax=Lindgomyces ingoldianus TaxID=673940 RepID=A0ACB6QRD7_9PLEO|nr:uncharacterized protein BDR25DRAFT_343980 [Lindgomyces ingoldianus]KAF2468665.1 hypothetical protein BDR25DRAFT_343980 [Lindgomyces ingoldianus]